MCLRQREIDGGQRERGSMQSLHSVLAWQLGEVGRIGRRSRFLGQAKRMHSHGGRELGGNQNLPATARHLRLMQRPGNDDAVPSAGIFYWENTKQRSPLWGGVRPPPNRKLPALYPPHLFNLAPCRPSLRFSLPSHFVLRVCRLFGRPVAALGSIHRPEPPRSPEPLVSSFAAPNARRQPRAAHTL